MQVLGGYLLGYNTVNFNHAYNCFNLKLKCYNKGLIVFLLMKAGRIILKL